jgi:hypothetical protein
MVVSRFAPLGGGGRWRGVCKVEGQEAPESMFMTEWMEQELRAARRELAEAERELAANTDAARTRYARALHEADLAERRAARQARERLLPGSQWRLAAV